MFDDLDKDLNKIDWFPIVKAHIAREPVKCRRWLTEMVNKELTNKDIGDILYHEKIMLESDLHELIESYMDLYWESREDMPND